jgi:hypothetical protein
VPAYLAQVQLGGPETEAEGAPEIFDLSQMATLQGMLETGIETVLP